MITEGMCPFALCCSFLQCIDQKSKIDMPVPPINREGGLCITHNEQA